MQLDANGWRIFFCMINLAELGYEKLQRKPKRISVLQQEILSRNFQVKD
jgi:hypothetical protein